MTAHIELVDVLQDHGVDCKTFHCIIINEEHYMYVPNV